MTVGFIGFGEADSSIALGLHGENVEEIVFFDAMQNDPRFSEKIKARGDAAGAEQCASAAEVARRAQVIFSAVPSNFAISAAEGALDGVHEGLIYTDVSTATPADKRTISAMIKERGGEYVDGAMMGPLLQDKHKVSMLLSGDAAEELKARMAPYHMRMNVVGTVPGVATSMKFIRSIYAKGISVLFIELFQAAQKFGVEEDIVASLVNTYGEDIANVIDRNLSGSIIHADRREHEMQNVVDFLKSEGLPYTMSEATREKLAWVRDTKIKDNFEGDVPRDWHGVLAGWKL